MILRGLISAITLVILMFPEMHVFSQGCFFSVVWETKRGEKRSAANPRSTKHWKSLFQINNSSFLYCSEIIRFLMNDEFRGPFGSTRVMKSMIFMNETIGFSESEGRETGGLEAGGNDA